MPNRFNGEIQDNFGRKLKDVKVTLTGKGVPSGKFTTTDENGKWLITLAESIESKDVTVTFTKYGLESRQVTNPQPTEILNTFIDPEKGGTLDLQGLYESGTYLVTSLTKESKSVLDQELEDLFQFIKNHPDNTRITITSSESQVTNNDNEDGDGINRTDEFRKTPGSLAKARAEALQKYVDDFLNKKYTENINLDPKLKPIIEFGDITRVGGEFWERFYAPDPKNPNILKQIERPDVIAKNEQLLKQYNSSSLNPDDKITRTADLPKYKQDQYTRITVGVKHEPTTINECYAGNLVFDVMYIKPGGIHGDTHPPGGVSHNCDNALFLLKANNILLKRDDGNIYASLNNKIGKDGRAPSSADTAGNTWSTTKTEGPFSPTVAEKFIAEIRQYDNVYTGYHSFGKYIEPINVALRAEAKKSFAAASLGRFSPKKVGEPISLSLDDKPSTDWGAGERFNRFIINSTTLKSIVNGLPDNEKIITFSLTCINSSTGVDEYYEIQTGKTDWFSGFRDKEGGWKNGCHKGVGTFRLYKIKQGTGDKSSNMVVSYTSDFLIGKTPAKKNQTLWLFKYDVCNNKITEFNDEVFSKKALSEVTGDGGGGGGGED
jgi:hypothetical protein